MQIVTAGAENDREPSVFTLARPPQKAAIIILIFAGMIAQALLYVVLPPILIPLSALLGGGREGAFFAQLSSTLPLFGVGLGGLIAGSLIERLGLKATTVVSLLTFGLMGTAAMFIATPWLFVASRLLMGLAIGFVTPCSSAIVAYDFSRAQRARMNGLLVSMGAMSGVLFVFVSAGMATAISWRSPLALHGIVAVIFLLPALLFWSPSARAAAPAAARQQGLRRLAAIAPLYVIGFAMLALTFMFNAKIAFILAEAHIDAPQTLARVFACNPLGAVIGSFLYARVNNRVGTTGALRIAFGLTAVALVLVAATSSAVVFGVAILMNGITNGFGLPALWTAVMNRAPRDIVPRALGFFSAAINFGASLGAVIIAPLAFALSSRQQYVAVALAIALVMILTIRRANPQARSA